MITPCPTTLSFLVTLLSVMAAGVCPAQVTTFSNEGAWQLAITSPSKADFEGLGGAVAAQYPGATFQSFAGGNPHTLDIASGFSPSAISGTSIMISSQDKGFGGIGWAVDFSPAVTGVGFWTGGLQFFGSTISFFDGQGGILGTFDLLDVTATPGAFSWAFTGFASTNPITRIEVSINTSDYVGHDDFQFGGVGLVGPTADAGPDQAIVAGETVLLDGSASFDDNTASSDLSYSWSLTQRPVGSNAFLVNPNMPLSSFVADVSGEYRATLIVTDEDGLSSDPDELVITSANARPMANAGGDQAGVVGFATVLDGSMSGDPNGDPITFAWSFQQIPTGSSAFLAATATANPHFIPDLPGVYTVELVVNDGLDDSDPDLVEVAVISGAEFAEFQLGLTIQWVSDLPVSWFTTKGNQMALTRHLTQALVALQNGNTGGALDKIEKALDRMDGCVLRGAPDGNGPGRDWIVDCSAQLAIYEALTQARDAIVV